MQKVKFLECVFNVFLWPVCVFAFAGGCARTDHLPTPADHMGKFQRVIVVEFYYDAPHEEFEPGFGKLLADRLADYTSGVDISRVASAELRGDFDSPLERGTVPLGFLTEMRERYMAEAVIIGRVDSFSPYYHNMALGMSIKALDTEDGTVFFSTSRTWKAGELDRRGDLRDYYERSYGDENVEYYGPDLLLISPSSFAEYIADRVARKLLATFNGEQ